MKLPSSWIKEWLRRTMLSDQQVVEALERAGIEIEQITSSKEIDKRVVVALVKKVIQHPGADRLHLADVEVGESTYRVVCGAPNVREGIKVAFAQIGTVLPDGDKIEKAKLRGEVSEGMLCSELELKIGNVHNGIYEVSSDVAIGTPLCDMFPSDTTIDIKTPANRFDVLSVVGLAREVAAMTSAELAPLVSYKQPKVDTVEIGEKVEATRYILARVKLGSPTPPSHSRSMAARLEAAGMRTVSPVVDVTNYAMLEFGQPLHAFDAAKVVLPVTARMAEAGETLVTLDGVERKLTAEDLIIADATGPIALAGLMGGASTEIDGQTSEILLEAAVFEGTVVRKMAKRHNLRTEASARFERGLPAELPGLALPHALHLLDEVVGASLVGLADAGQAKAKTRSLDLPLPHLRKVLGFDISHKEALGALHKLQIETSDSHKDIITVTQLPWWRPDLVIAEDLVEEIVRVVGYDKVPSSIPSWRPQNLQFDRVRAKRRRVRDVMFASGLFEVMTYSFVSHDQLVETGADVSRHLKLKNPLSLEQAYLRSSMLASHLAVLARNRMYGREIGFYELSNVFLKRAAGEQPEEPLRLAVMMSRPEHAYHSAKGVLDALTEELNLDLTFEVRDEMVFAPGRAATVRLGDLTVGLIGQLHPRRLRELKIDGEAAYFEVDLTPLVEASRSRQFGGTERFPKIVRDLAVVVPQSVTWQAVSEVLTNYQVAFVSDYYGKELPPAHKGMTVRITLANAERTPTEVEAVALEAAVFKRLAREVGAVRR